MKRTLSAVIATAAILASGSAHAELMHNGKPRKMVADRIIEREQLVCTYGSWQSETLPNGSTIISRTKTCPRPGVK